MRRRGLFAIVALLAPFAAPELALADDSTATIEAGGLNFVVNRQVSMSEEELTLSPDHVHVRYLFTNGSNQDFEGLVAFPLPEIDVGEEGNYAIHAADPANPLDFKAASDGKPIDVKVEARSTALGVDISALLAKSHLPPTTIFADDATQQKFYDSLDKLPKEALDELERYGAVSVSRGKNGEATDVNPLWTTSIVYDWMQRFPAMKSTEITHDYQPAPRDFFADAAELAAPAMAKAYCPDASFLATARAWEKQGGLSGKEVRFVLKTGRNWLGPIGRFRLTFDKLDAKAIVSTCFKGLRKTGPTTFEASLDNFSPDDDLGFLALSFFKPE